MSMRLMAITLSVLVLLGGWAGSTYLLRQSSIPPESLTHLSMVAILRAATKYASETGQFPTTLEQMDGLEPSDLVDAWGHPLIYELRSDGLLILSTRLQRDDLSAAEDGHEMRYCAATKRADGSLALVGEYGYPLYFLEEHELTIYEFARLAETYNARARVAGATAAAEWLRSREDVLDGWGTPIRVLATENTIRLESLGADRRLGFAADAAFPYGDVDRFAELQLTRVSGASWEYFYGDVEGPGERSLLLELDRDLR